MGCTSSTPQANLATYNKRANRLVLNPSYEHIETIFQEIATSSLNDKDLTILDVGSGVGTHLSMLSTTFLTDNNDTLICTDPSPKCLQFVRQLTEKDKHLKNQTVRFIQNSAHSLCLTSQYESSAIDLCFMAFALHHISSKNTARDTILKEIYQCLKPNGIFVLLESMSSKAFLDRTENKNISPLNKNEDTDSGSDSEWIFNESHDLIQYVESFGFQLGKQILENELEKHWVLVFRK